MPHPTRRVLGLTTAAVVAAGIATAASTTATAAATPGKLRVTSSLTGTTVHAMKSATGQIAKSNTKLLGRTDRALTNVMVKLDVDPAASYTGGVKGFAATSPDATGKKFDKSAAATKSYVAHVNAYAASAAARIKAAVPAAKVVRTFSVAYGGLLVRLPAADAKKLVGVAGVAAVQSDAVNHPLSDASASASTEIANDTTRFVGANKVWPQLGGQAKAGQGVIVGVLDTGVWPEHPMLRDTGLAKPKGGPWACDFGDGSDPALGASFSCNNKLIGAYAFLDTNLAVNGAEDGEYCDVPAGVCSARDADGHGTHTSTTAAGDRVPHADLLGVDRGPISGIAPGASVIMYRVCLVPGCYSSDSVAAVQQAIEDGVDVINFSIGGGAQAYSDPVELAFLDAYAAGINVNASAGNSGPGEGTAEHAGPWVTTVGASTSDRAFQTRMVLTADNGDTYAKTGATVTDGVTDRPVVQAVNVPGYTGSELCDAPFPADSVTGKVVVCQRGGNARVDKGYNALQGGAAGMILYNPTASDTETDNHWLPAVHLDGPNDALLAFLGSHSGVTATWTEGQKATVRGDVMAGFSSRGPDGDFIKPDVTAPGVQVLAGNTPTPIETTAGPPGQYYQAIAGTSMSSPHSAGISALVRAAHPDWSVGQIKSALMTSSLQSVINADGTATTPWDRGAGSLRADRAVKPNLTFNVPAAAYYASAADPLHRVDLNLPSINANPLPGSLTTSRSVRNVSDTEQTFNATVQTKEGLRITVSPSSFTLAPGASKKLSITLDGTRSKAGWHFAQITLKPTTPKYPVSVVLPVAVNTSQSSLALSQTCKPRTVSVNENTTCTVTAQNNAQAAADATVKVQPDAGVLVSNVTKPASKTSYGAVWKGTLDGSKAPTIDSITPGSSAGGYLPLSSFGIGATPGVGDETITNFDVPNFQFGGEQYGRVGVDSNGYVVIGGGSSTDNVCCDIPAIPNAARPNNIIAPFWTDLSFDPATGGGALRVATLTDGVNNFLIIDYDHVKTYGTGGSGLENSFEVWITLGDTEDVSMEYGTLGGTDTGDHAFGAENRDGTSGVAIDEPESDTSYTVNAGSPTPGGSVTFTYQASASTTGTFRLLASATAPTVRGTTTVATNLRVVA